MVQIAFLLWALFFIVIGYSMMPGTITLCIIISFIGGLIDGFRKIKKEKKAMAGRRKIRYKDLYDAEGWII